MDMSHKTESELPLRNAAFGDCSESVIFFSSSFLVTPSFFYTLRIFVKASLIYHGSKLGRKQEGDWIAPKLEKSSCLENLQIWTTETGAFVFVDLNMVIQQAYFTAFFRCLYAQIPLLIEASHALYQ